jgi:hypothetical protein
MAADDQSQKPSVPPAVPSGPADQGLALGERRQAPGRDTGTGSIQNDPSEESTNDGMTWRQVMGIIGFIAGLLLTIVSISNPDQAWSLVQKPLIAVSVGVGAWLFFFRWPARWNWAIGSLSLLLSAFLLLAESPWMEALGLASLGLGAGSWCAWGYRDKKRSGWFSTFLTLTAYMVLLAAAVVQAKQGNPWWLIGFGGASCLAGGALVRSTLAKPLKPPLWWRIRHVSGRTLLATGIVAPYITLILQKVM